MTGTITISGSYAVATGTNTIAQTITLAQTVRTIIANVTVPHVGSVTLLPPAGAQIIIFIPPTSNTHAITMSSLAMNMTQPSMIPIDLLVQSGGIVLSATGVDIPNCTVIYL